MAQIAQALLIKGGRIIDPSQGIDRAGDLFVVEGRVAWVGEGQLSDSGYTTLNARGMVVAPGFIDLHCHLREPGFEDKETIATGTQAAARGGFTTVCCMPNTTPPIDTRATVEFIQRAARERGLVRVLPIGCITRGQRGEELAEMGELAACGVVAFSDDGRPVANPQLMRHALEYSSGFGLPIIDHCEEPALAEGGVMNEGWVATRLGLKGIPAAAEEVVVARDIALAALTKGRLHIAHVSTAGSVDLIRRAKDKGIAVTAEVTPHHLTLTQEWVIGHAVELAKPSEAALSLRCPEPAEGSKGASLLAYDTNAKVNPPLRTREDIQALVRGLKEGVIDAIATDHAPHTLVDKLCEFDDAAFGISGLETALGGLMGLVESGELELSLLIEKLTAGPARILTGGDPATLPARDLDAAIGTLKPGAPGDVTVFDPRAEWAVDPATFASKGKNTPLAGCRLRGKVMATVVGGKVVFRDEHVKLEGV